MKKTLKRTLEIFLKPLLKMKLDELNQNFFLKTVSKLQQCFLVVISVFEITPRKFLKIVDVRITSKIVFNRKNRVIKVLDWALRVLKWKLFV